MEILLDRETHVYSVDGKNPPANTKILEDQGLINLDGIPKNRLERKSALGTAVHYCIHLHETNNLDESSVHPEILPYFNAYKKFCEVYRFEPRFTELPLYSKKWGFCTTLDLQGPFNYCGKENESIIELKCTWNMREANAIQTAAQHIAFDENYPDIKNKRRFGLKLNPNQNFDIYLYDNPRDREIFLGALVVYKWREQHGLLKKEN